MWERYGQLAKKIIDRAVGAYGTLRIEHEVPLADAQSGDVYFVPEPGKKAGRAHLGWLDRITREPCLLEMLQRTPGPVDARNNIRKQLTLDHAIAVEAEKKEQPRPPLLRLWQITTGRPDDVLKGYKLARARGWPPGFWVSARLHAMGILVLSELPRQRDTVLLRLFGRGRVLREAVADLKALPRDAPERDVAMPPLVALRFEVKEDPQADDEARAFLMATRNLYEEWEIRVKAEGEAHGLASALVAAYETRFGPMPQVLRKALAKVVDPALTSLWMGLFITAPAKEIAAAIRNGKPR